MGLASVDSAWLSVTLFSHGLRDWSFAAVAFSASRSTSFSPWFSEWAALCANCFGGFCFIGYAWPIQSKQHGEEPSIEEDWPPQAPWGNILGRGLCWRAAFAYSTATAGKRNTEDCSQIGAFRSEPEEGGIREISAGCSWDGVLAIVAEVSVLLPKCLACHVSLRRPMICRQAFGQPGLLRHERFWGTGGGRQHDNTPHLKDPKEKQNKWMLRRQACCKTLHGAVHLCRVFQGFQNLWRIGRLWPALAWSSRMLALALEIERTQRWRTSSNDHQALTTRWSVGTWAFGTRMPPLPTKQPLSQHFSAASAPFGARRDPQKKYERQPGPGYYDVPGFTDELLRKVAKRPAVKPAWWRRTVPKSFAGDNRHLKTPPVSCKKEFPGNPGVLFKKNTFLLCVCCQ